MSALGSSASSATGRRGVFLENTARYKRNLARYAQTHKLSKPNAARIRRETRRLAIFGEALRNRPRQQVVPQPKVLDGGLVSAWSSFRERIYGLPIYYMTCHGATCASYTDCDAPARNTNPPPGHYPSFTLPDNTFMINLVNGDICQVNRYTERLIAANQKNFKNALLVDSPNDSTQAYDNSWESPILSSIYRSSPGTTYPNYKCVFEQSIYRMGVLNLSILDEHGNATRVYYPTEEQQSRTIFIEDVIRQVIATSGPGIFILAACAGPYRTTFNSLRANEYATTLVSHNELAYTTHNPTLSVGQITSFDPSFSIRDVGSVAKVSVIHPWYAGHAAAALREHPATIFPENQYETHLEMATALLRELKTRNNFRSMYGYPKHKLRRSRRLKKHRAASI
jgi:hypothetical protein